MYTSLWFILLPQPDHAFAQPLLGVTFQSELLPKESNEEQLRSLM